MGSKLIYDRCTSLAFIAGAVTSLLLALIGLQQWRAARAEAGVRTALAQSTERAQLVGDYLSALRDIETGQRGFLVTNDPAYLQPLEQARKVMPAQIKALRSANWGTHEQRDLAAQLVATGEARTKRALATVELMKEGDRQQATAIIVEGTGKRLMDHARLLADLIGHAELRSSTLLVERSADDRRARQRQIYLTEAAALVSLALLLFALFRLVGSLRETTEVLSDTATRQTAVFEGATDAMMMLDERGFVESVNSAAVVLFGRSASDIIGKSNLALFKDPPSNEVSQAYLKRLAAGQMAGNRQLFEGLRGDGTTVDAEVVTTPIELADGLRFLAVARDVTERRQIERMKNEFVATVSHELRTPLTSVAGSLGLILGGAAGEVSEKATRLVQIACNNCNRLIRLINDMLDIEKIESGKTVLNLQPVNLASSIDHAVSALAAFAGEHDVSIAVEPIAEDWQVFADPDRLVQILTNLASNAVKFSPPEGEMTIKVGRRDHDMARVSIIDRGPGISDEFRGRIFQKFAQADSTDSRQKGGTGLGLSIVKELIERMGGRVGFHSVEGEGAEFYFDLPVFGAAHAVGKGSPRLGRMDQSSLPQILHVDDDPDTLRLIASAFEGRAIVLSSPSLVEARATIDRYDFDLVILDIAMPDGNGLTLIPLINAAGEEQVPIIVYTALDETADDKTAVFARLTKSKASLGSLVRTAEQALAQSTKLGT